MGEKMWAVFSLLMNSEECISAEDIQRQLEEKGYDIGLKAVYAVIKQINAFTALMFGKEIIKAVRRFGYIIEAGCFDEAQIQLLIDMVNYRQDLSNGDKKELINKLLKFCSAKQKDCLIIPKIEEDEKENYSFSETLMKITSAIRNKKDIRFQYVDYNIRDDHPNETHSTKGNAGLNHEFYNVSPYNTVIVDGHYYLRAYYNKHKDSLTTFRIDRIRKLDFSRTYYFDFDDEEKMSESFKQSLAKSMNSFFDGEEITLHIKFDKALIREVVSRFGKDIVVKNVLASADSKDKRQWYETSVEGIVFNTGLMNWIRQFGPMMVVVGPEKLRKSITEALEESLSYYKK